MGVAMNQNGNGRGPKRLLGLDYITKSLRHTQHCTGSLIDAAWRDPKELDDLSTINSAKFSTCDVLVDPSSGKVVDSTFGSSQGGY